MGLCECTERNFSFSQQNEEDLRTIMVHRYLKNYKNIKLKNVSSKLSGNKIRQQISPKREIKQISLPQSQEFDEDLSDEVPYQENEEMVIFSPLVSQKQFSANASQYQFKLTAIGDDQETANIEFQQPNLFDQSVQTEHPFEQSSQTNDNPFDLSSQIDDIYVPIIAKKAPLESSYVQPAILHESDSEINFDSLVKMPQQTPQFSASQDEEIAAFVFRSSRQHVIRNPAPKLDKDLKELNLKGHLTLDYEIERSPERKSLNAFNYQSLSYKIISRIAFLIAAILISINSQIPSLKFYNMQTQLPNQIFTYRQRRYSQSIFIQPYKNYQNISPSGLFPRDKSNLTTNVTSNNQSIVLSKQSTILMNKASQNSINYVKQQSIDTPRRLNRRQACLSEKPVRKCSRNSSAAKLKDIVDHCKNVLHENNKDNQFFKRGDQSLQQAFKSLYYMTENYIPKDFHNSEKKKLVQLFKYEKPAFVYKRRQFVKPNAKICN